MIFSQYISLYILKKLIHLQVHDVRSKNKMNINLQFWYRLKELYICVFYSSRSIKNYQIFYSLIALWFQNILFQNNTVTFEPLATYYLYFT